MSDVDAVLLAGGAARRLGGIAKPELVVGGRRLVDVAVAAVGSAGRIVLVGPDPGGLQGVGVVHEEPVGAGPVAAIAAGLAAVADTSATYLVVLACDLPYVHAGTIVLLQREIGERDVALLVDATGRDQPLIALWRREALSASLADADPAGRSVRSLLRSRAVARATDDTARPAWYDCDTQAELDEARRQL